MGRKKIQQGIEGSSSTRCNKKSKNDPKIVHHGQVKSITLDEIEGAYKIAIIHVGFYGAEKAILCNPLVSCSRLSRICGTVFTCPTKHRYNIQQNQI